MHCIEVFSLGTDLVISCSQGSHLLILNEVLMPILILNKPHQNPIELCNCRIALNFLPIACSFAAFFKFLMSQYLKENLLLGCIGIRYSSLLS